MRTVSGLIDSAALQAHPPAQLRSQLTRLMLLDTALAQLSIALLCSGGKCTDLYKFYTEGTEQSVLWT